MIQLGQKGGFCQILLLVSAAIVGCGNLKASPQGTFRGVLSLESLFKEVWTTNRYEVEVHAAGPKWTIELKSVTGQDHYKTFCDGTSTVWEAFYPEANDKVGLNTAMIKIFPGTRVFDARPEEHVWFALFSDKLFEEKKTPLRDQGLCLGEPGTFTEVQMSRGQSSPQRARWHNEFFEINPTYGKIAGKFDWEEDAAAHAKSIEFPYASRLEMELVQTNGISTPVTRSKLVFQDYSPVAGEIDSTPELVGRQVVYEYRKGDIWKRDHVTYGTTNGIIPQLASSAVENALNVSNIHQLHHGTTKFQYVILLGFLISSAGFGWILLKNKNKLTSNSTDQTTNISNRKE